MFRTFFPDEYLDSTYEIDFEKLYQDGYRGLIFDNSLCWATNYAELF